MVEWEEFDDISQILKEYLPLKGEGNNKATQVSTCINKLVYKWYNDGDVYDNNYYMDGWCNDISSYANWLYNHCDCMELNEIKNINSESQYEELLFKMASKFTPEVMEKLENEPKEGSIYEEDEPFSFREWEEEDEYEDW